jgi:hypothetical protein
MRAALCMYAKDVQEKRSPGGRRSRDEGKTVDGENNAGRRDSVKTVLPWSRAARGRNGEVLPAARAGQTSPSEWVCLALGQTSLSKTDLAPGR